MKTSRTPQIQHQQLRRLLADTTVKVHAPIAARRLLEVNVRDAWRAFHRKPKE